MRRRLASRCRTKEGAGPAPGPCAVPLAPAPVLALRRTPPSETTPLLLSKERCCCCWLLRGWEDCCCWDWWSPLRRPPDLGGDLVAPFD